MEDVPALSMVPWPPPIPPLPPPLSKLNPQKQYLMQVSSSLRNHIRSLLSVLLSRYTRVFSWHHSRRSMRSVEMVSARSDSSISLLAFFREVSLRVVRLGSVPLLLSFCFFRFLLLLLLPPPLLLLLCRELMEPLRARKKENWGLVCALVSGERRSSPSKTWRSSCREMK